MNITTEKELANIFWKRVKALCKQRKITQSELCTKTDIDIGKLKSQITNNVAPKVFDAQQIATCLNTSVEYLVNGKETDENKIRLDSLLSELSATVDKYKHPTTDCIQTVTNTK